MVVDLRLPNVGKTSFFLSSNYGDIFYFPLPFRQPHPTPLTSSFNPSISHLDLLFTPSFI